MEGEIRDLLYNMGAGNLQDKTAITESYIKTDTTKLASGNSIVNIRWDS